MDYFLGGITLFAGNFAPLGWAFCDGAALPIQQNAALFAILGTTYGGNGTSEFNLPNLSGVGGTKYIIALTGIFPQRN